MRVLAFPYPSRTHGHHPPPDQWGKSLMKLLERAKGIEPSTLSLGS
jgi:hypothetical protein